MIASADTFTDRDATRLLELLAKYARVFAADHSSPAITVKELADDLTESSEYDADRETLRDAVYNGLNNSLELDVS